MTDSVDEFTQEQGKLAFYHRGVAKYNKKVEEQQKLLQKEGATLTEEEASIKPPQEPSRYEALLVSNQINNYCKQINQFAGQSFSKLFLIDGIFQKPQN